jgi:hypothetical protein
VYLHAGLDGKSKICRLSELVAAGGIVNVVIEGVDQRLRKVKKERRIRLNSRRI